MLRAQREVNSAFTTHIQEDGLLYLTASSLSVPSLAHGFSTRLGGVSRGVFAALNLGLHRGDSTENVQENYRRFCAVLGVAPQRCVLARQVHRDDVKVVTAQDAGAGFLRPQDYEADALVTNVPGLTLTIFSADCIPTLYFDPVTRCIGAAHAGWRGTALGIAAKTIAAMERLYGAKAEHIRAAIGPGISRCCFETDADVPAAMRAALGAEVEPYLQRSAQDGKWHVDLKAINRHWMLRAGLAPEHIAVRGACTACCTDLYWSHRRMGDVRGSQAAMICLKETP